MSQNIEINPENLLRLYLDRQFDRLSEKFIQVLQYFERNLYVTMPPEEQYAVDLFIKHFLYLFTQPDYTLGDAYLAPFIRLNPTIANLTAISSFRTTDAYVEILRHQPHNYVKLLTLYSARNTIEIGYDSLFALNPQFACLWYCCYCELYRSGLADPNAQRRLKAHLVYDNEHLTEFFNISDLCFGATYIDPEQDRQLKQKINHSLRKNLARSSAQICNRPNPKKIAVVTSLWFTQHSVHRTLSEFVESLKDNYELTLIQLCGPRDNVDIGPFQRVKYVYFEGNVLNLASIRDNEYAVLFYPDIGMNAESIFLSNLRIAPIQICGTGHPVSTFGSEIDYFVSGAAVELKEGAEEHYSERLVLLPGFGAIHNPPSYRRRHPGRGRPEFVVNCSWYSQKVNYPMLCILGEILRGASKQLVFRFFSGGSLLWKNEYLPFVRTLESALGKEHVEVIPARPYEEYMALMEEGDLCLESHPFGGSNVVADSLHLRLPIVTFEGRRWYNRIGSQMVRAAGFAELVAENEKEYIRLALRMIHDDPYRESIRGRLEAADLQRTVFGSGDKYSFRQAVDWLIENHERLKSEGSRQPIRI